MRQFAEFFGPRAVDFLEGRCRYCGRELPESEHGRKYCCRSHRQRAYEERHGLKRGDTYTTTRSGR